ncbi:MAG: disulfide bond formation protein DsbC, partial [Methylobacter sp.]
MKAAKLFAILAMSGAICSSVIADETAIKKSLVKTNPEIEITSVKPSPVPGISEVVVGNEVLYMSDDGKYLFQGYLLDLEAHKNITQEKLAEIRKVSEEKVRPLVKSRLAAMSTDKMIVFSPKDPKYKIFVFTDIDCGYCRKFHSQINDYMAEGIAVHYL